MKKISLLVITGSIDLFTTTLMEALVEKVEIGDIQHFTNLDSAIKIANAYDVAIVLLDFPISNLLNKITNLAKKGIKILFILDKKNKYSFRYFTKLPIHGFISTLSSYDELITTINTLAVKNLKYISPHLLTSINDITGNNLFSSLSKKEIDVFEMAISGKKSKDIADTLKISPKTVSTYKSRIYKKLDVNNDVELFKLAMNHNLEHLWDFNEIFSCNNDE